jgi:uncharacterized membrane protein YhaH (DUF805 family)
MGEAMRGVIQAIATDGTYGQITADDGTQYSYWTVEIQNGTGSVGQAVEFQISDGQPIDIVLTPPAPAVAARGQIPPAAALPAAPPSMSGSSYWIKLFTSPNGRVSRRQFWLHGFLPLFVTNIVLGLIPLIGTLVTIAAFWGSICISFKRFHDRGLSGLWSFLYIVPLIIALGLAGAAMADVADTLRLAGIFSTISGIVVLVQFFMVYVRAGEQGDNQYGPDPLAAPPY